MIIPPPAPFISQSTFLDRKPAIRGCGYPAHFHNTHGQGLANVVAALEAGVTTFDASQGGIGGCPYAPGATGNIVTEDLVFLLESMGLRTGIDLDRLIAARTIITEGLPDLIANGRLRIEVRPPVHFQSSVSGLRIPWTLERMRTLIIHFRSRSRKSRSTVAIGRNSLFWWSGKEIKP